MPSIGLKALPLKECISLRIHYFSLNIENTMFPYHMVPTKEIEKTGGMWAGVFGKKFRKENVNVLAFFKDKLGEECCVVTVLFIAYCLLLTLHLSLLPYGS